MFLIIICFEKYLFFITHRDVFNTTKNYFMTIVIQISPNYISVIDQRQNIS